MGNTMEEKEILRLNKNGLNKEPDKVVLEVPLTIYLNEQEFVTLLCTPELTDMLAIGFLRSEGLIDDIRDIKSLRVDAEQGFVFLETTGSKMPEKLYGKRIITSGCGKGTIFFNVLDSLKTIPVTSSLIINPKQIRNLLHLLQEKAFIFKTTGGTHSAAICSPSKMIYFCEDIGRHNAVDKLIGFCLKNNISTHDKILLTSGRVSSEILAKVAKLEIPILISRAAPTTLSIELSQKLNITLIGFARGNRFNIYSNSERIQFDGR